MWERRRKGCSVHISRKVSRELEAEGWTGPTLFSSTVIEGSQLGQLNGVEGWIEKEMSKSAEELVTRKLTSSNAIKIEDSSKSFSVNVRLSYNVIGLFITTLSEE